MPVVFRLQRGLNHGQTDGADLFEPLPFSSACRLCVRGYRSAQKSNGKIAFRAGPMGLQPEHMAIDLILEPVVPAVAATRG